MIKPLIHTALFLVASTGLLRAAEAPAGATAAADTVSPERLALADKVLVAMRAEQNMKSSMEMVRRSISGMTKSMVGEAMGNEVKPEDLESMKKAQDLAIDIVEKDLAWDNLKGDLARIYAETYTVPEMRAMIAFYTSPEGASILEKTPVATAKSVELMQKRMSTIMPKILAETKKYTESITAARKAELAKQVEAGAHSHAQ